MALILETRHPAGFDAQYAYWVVEEMPLISPRGALGPARVVLRAYLDQSAKESDKPHIAERVVELPWSEIQENARPEDRGDPRPAIYRAVKKRPGWEDAADI